MEDVDDDPGAVEHTCSGRALEVSGLARRDLVIDDHDGRFRGVWVVVRVRIFFGGLPLFSLCRLPSLTGLRLFRGRAGGDDPLPARPLGEILQLAFADDGRGGERVAVLRNGRDDVVPQGLHEPAELRQIARVIRVGNVGKLNPDENGQGAKGRRVAHGCEGDLQEDGKTRKREFLDPLHFPVFRQRRPSQMPTASVATPTSPKGTQGKPLAGRLTVGSGSGASEGGAASISSSAVGDGSASISRTVAPRSIFFRSRLTRKA